MSNVGNKYKIGILVIAGAAVLIFGLLALGAFKSFRKTFNFCTVVSSSVQGLDKGAKVKFRGVTIGQVTNIKIMHNLSNSLIIMKFDPEAFVSSYEPKVDIKLNRSTLPSLMEKLVDKVDAEIAKGLRCKLQYASITGNLYIDMDYVNPDDNPPMQVALPPDAPKVYIPSVETATIAAVIAESQKTMMNIGRIDFERLANKMEKFMDDADRLLCDKRVEDSLSNTAKITNDLRDVSNVLKLELSQDNVRKLNDEVQKLFNNLNKTMDDLRDTVKSMDMPATAERARALLESSDRLIRKAEGLRDELSQSIVKLDSALDAARLLLDLLERNPDSILRGKGAVPVLDKQ